MKPFSIYIHIPYCLQKCPYCDFNTYALLDIPERDYVSALMAELDHAARQPEWIGRSVQSIYFGGGTPSLFHPNSIGMLLGAICRYFSFEPLAEFTIEANPGTVDPDRSEQFSDVGINRFSLGVQSFQAATLETLGRVHSVSQIEIAIEALYNVGISNINLDLMYGVPGQTVQSVQNDLETAVAFEPQHISAYGLTIEKGTPFYQACKSGRMKLPPEAELLEMMGVVHQFLPTKGFERYEISNFARPGKEACHNLAYWNRNDYLGLGAGAHSYCEQKPGTSAKRWSNYAFPNRYMEEATAHGCATSWSDELKRRDLMFEFFFLGLRKLAGVSPDAFHHEFDLLPQEAYPTLLELLTDRELIEVTDQAIKLTQRGLLLADSVIENFSDVEFENRLQNSPPWQVRGEQRNGTADDTDSNLVAINAG